MPFTLSHPAAVAALWPVARRGRPWLAALVIGAMTPDLEYLLRLRTTAVWGHSLLGLLRFCLPVGLLVLLAWEWRLRDATRYVLALPTERPSAGAAPSTSAWWLRGAAGVLLGAATHLLWDGPTHAGYWGAALWPGLRAPALSLFGRVVPWYNLLQHLSTLVGGLVVLAWVGRELRRADSVRQIARSPRRLAALGGVAATAAAVGLWNALRWAADAPTWDVRIFVGRLAVGTLLGLALAMLAGGLLLRPLDRAGAAGRDSPAA